MDSLFFSVGAVRLVSADSSSISLLALFSVSDLSVTYSCNQFHKGQDDRETLKHVTITLEHYLHHVHHGEHGHILQRSVCGEVTLLCKISDAHEQPANLLHLKDDVT